MTRTTGPRRLLSRWLLAVVASAGVVAASADTLDDILAREALRVGTAEFAPWAMQSEDGALSGFDVDVARKIATDMGVSPIFKVYAWEELIPALNRGDIDLIVAGMSITPARALQVTFTQPIAVGGIGLATNIEKTDNIAALDQLNAKAITVAAVEDTLAESVAEMFFESATLDTFATASAAEAALLDGRAHAYLATLPEVKFLAIRHAAAVDVPLGEPLLASSEAMAVKRGDQALLNFLNAWVTARQTDRWLETTRAYWFDTLNWAQSADE